MKFLFVFYIEENCKEGVVQMKLKNEKVSILVENEILIEQGNKVLENTKRLEVLLTRINRIGNCIKAGWKGEAGELCYERLYEIIQHTEQAKVQMEAYTKEVLRLVEKG